MPAMNSRSSSNSFSPREVTETALPFAPLEAYMLLDDRPAYPMDSIRLLHFTGRLSAQILQSALEALLKRQPLLTRKAEKRGSRFVWVPADSKPEILWWDADTENSDSVPGSLNASGFPVMKHLNLLEGPGLRIYVTESKRQNWTKILFQFHHSVSDGLGEMQILGEFLTHYARIAGLIPAETPLLPVDSSKLPLRCRIGWSFRSWLWNSFHTDFTLRHLAYGRPLPLFRHKPIPGQTPSQTYPFLRSLPLNLTETQNYVRKAKSLKVTVNDLLLRDFFLTIAAFRKQTGRDFSSGTTRIMVPMSLRKPCHEGMPAANLVSSIFLDRSQRQISAGPQKLLVGIHHEMELTKKHDQKYVFLTVLRILNSVPGLLEMFLDSSKCRSTGVLSNLGRVLEIAPVPRTPEGKIQLGESVLEFVDAAPPIRSQTMISFSALTYAGALRLCLRYDHHFMTLSDANEFLKIFHEKLISSLSEG